MSRLLIFMILASGIVPLVIKSAKADDFDRRYLAVDQSLHLALDNAEMVMGRASDHRALVRADEDWEVANDLNIRWVNSIVRGPDDQYRMYYGMANAGGERLALATSPDGKNWTRQVTNVGIPGSNFIELEGQAFYNADPVFYDPQDNDYKMVWLEGRTFNMARSTDGVHFQTTLSNALTHKADSLHSAFHDSQKGEYVIYGRKRGDWRSGDQDRRGVPRHSAPQWDSGPWPSVGEVVADPMDFWEYETHPRSIDAYPDGAGTDIYAPNVQEYHGQYIGLPAVFHRDPSRVPFTRPNRVTGPIYPMVMHSTDGEDWDFPELEESILDVSPHERVNPWKYATDQTTAEVGQIYPAANFVEIDDELLIFYKWRDDTHYEAGTADHPNPHYDPQVDAGIDLQTLRVDGFASIQAEEGKTGQWITFPLSVPEGTQGLRVNADVSGSLRVEVFDSTATPIPGLSLDDSVAFVGDDTGAMMDWRSDHFGAVAGQDVYLRFVVDDGAIYSFSFSPVPEPSSALLLGLIGALPLLRRKRRRG